MRAAIALRNIIGKAENILLVGIIPLHRKLDFDIVLLPLDIDYLFMNRRLVFIQMFDERPNSSFILEYIFLVTTLIYQMNMDTRVQKRKFSEPFGQNIVMKLDIAEYCAAGPKA